MMLIFWSEKLLRKQNLKIIKGISFSLAIGIIIVSLLSHEGPRHQNLGHLYRKTHNKKTNINQNWTLKIKNIV